MGVPESERVSRPTEPDALVLEAWGQGLLVGALLVMFAITIANMRKRVLLHKLILAEVSMNSVFFKRQQYTNQVIFLIALPGHVPRNLDLHTPTRIRMVSLRDSDRIKRLLEFTQCDRMDEK